MKKLNIGLDFDNVIIDTAGPILNILGLFFNEVYNLSSIKTYNIADNLWIDKTVVQDAIDLVLTDTDLPVNERTCEVIKWLSQFYNIYIVTSRHKENIDYVYTILDKHKLSDYIVDIISSDDKVETSLGLDIDTFIEDRAFHINKIKLFGINTLIYDKPWNQNIEMNELTYRVYNWADIKDYFMIKLGAN